MVVRSVASPVANFGRQGVPDSSSVAFPVANFGKQGVPDSSSVASPVANFGRQGVPDSSFVAFFVANLGRQGAPKFSFKFHIQPFGPNCPSKVAVRNCLWQQLAQVFYPTFAVRKNCGEVGRPVFLPNLCSQRNWEQ